MEFSILEIIRKDCEDVGIFVSGVAHNPLRIDFIDATEEQKEEAYRIASRILEREDILRSEYTKEEAKKVTPEKVQPLVDLLVSKGILTLEEINAL